MTRYNAKKDFTESISKMNLHIMQYETLAPLCKQVVEKYEREMQMCYFGGGFDNIYFCIQFKGEIPEDFFCTCERLKLTGRPDNHGYSDYGKYAYIELAKGTPIVSV